MIRSVITLLLSIVCLGPSMAAEPGGPGIRALLLVPGGPVATIHPMSGDTVGKGVVVGARGLSEPFRAPARVFSLALPDPKQESGFRAVGEVTLPPGGDDFILLLEPLKSAFKVHAVNAREARFGANGILFFNASEANIGVSLGSSRLLVKPRVPVFAKPPGGGAESYYQVTFFEADNGGVRPFTNTRWPHRDNSRCYVFLYRNQKGRFTYQAVDESLPPPAAAE